MDRMNKFGLTRSIPAKVARAVRQRDGFGCIICGKAIYEYEHFDPEFADAETHSVDGIVLLCDEHHSLKTRKLLSKDTIRRYLNQPKCRETGFSYGPFDIGTTHPTIEIGVMKCSQVDKLIVFDGEEILSILPPVQADGPFRINAKLRDYEGKVILEIVENEWRTPSDNWDVKISGPRISINKAHGDIVLALRSEPPYKIVIERLNMAHKGHLITCREGENLRLLTKSGHEFSAHQIEFGRAEVAIEADENGLVIGRRAEVLSMSGMMLSSARSASSNDTRMAYHPQRFLFSAIGLADLSCTVSRHALCMLGCGR